MKSRMLISMLVIALAAAVIGGATMAWFTDSDTSEDVTFTAGTLLIDIEKFNIITTDINLDILNPGDSWAYEIDVENEGTKNLIYKVAFCWQDILGNTLVNFAGREGFGTDPLSDVLEFEIKDSNGKIKTSGTLKGKSKPLEFEVGQLAPGDTDSYTIEVVFPKGAGNEYQGSKMKATFAVLAKQIHPEAKYPEFECLQPFPSTNYLNQSGKNPYKNCNPAPYVKLLSATASSVELEFNMPRNFNAVFEYRVDGQKDFSSVNHDGNIYPWLDDEYFYNDYFTLNNNTFTKTFEGVQNKVEVRHAAGAESYMYFDWTPFFVVK